MHQFSCFFLNRPRISRGFHLSALKRPEMKSKGRTALEECPLVSEDSKPGMLAEDSVGQVISTGAVKPVLTEGDNVRLLPKLHLVHLVLLLRLAPFLSSRQSQFILVHRLLGRVFKRELVQVPGHLIVVAQVVGHLQ